MGGGWGGGVPTRDTRPYIAGLLQSILQRKFSGWYSTRCPDRPWCVHACMHTCIHTQIPTYLHTYNLHTSVPGMHACMHAFLNEACLVLTEEEVVSQWSERKPFRGFCRAKNVQCTSMFLFGDVWESGTYPCIRQVWFAARVRPPGLLGSTETTWSTCALCQPRQHVTQKIGTGLQAPMMQETKSCLADFAT